MEQTLLISWPPSVNSIWRAVKGRNIVSARYRRWREIAGKELILQRPKKFSGPVNVHIELCSPTQRAFDLDNRAKATLDLLVCNGIIQADDTAVVRSLTLSVGSSFVGALVHITPHADQQEAA